MTQAIGWLAIAGLFAFLLLASSPGNRLPGDPDTDAR
jgi:hypothetical protein